MKHLPNLCALIATAALSLTFANAQTASEATQRFDEAGVVFDFPAGWKATDNSDANVQYITVAPKDGGVQISIISQLATGEQCDFQTAGKKITDALVERVATQIHTIGRQTSPVTTQFGGLKVDGFILHGRMNDAPVTGEIYSFRLGFRFLSLVCLRKDGEVRGSLGSLGWEVIRNSLKISPPVLGAAAVRAGVNPNPNVLNGRALHLGRPDYPAIARRAHASGIVVVQVTIDETGKVVSAQAVAGHPLLRGSAEVAARGSEFSATKLCGEPVRISGLITYNFVAQ